MLGMLREPDPGRRHLEEVFGGVLVDFICFEQGNVSANGLKKVPPDVG